MKCDLNAEMEVILGIYRCEQFTSLLEDIFELVMLYNVDETNDWVKDVVGEIDTRDVRLARTAYLISRLADNHHRLLRKVHQLAPGFWKRAEQVIKKEKLCLNN